MGIEIRDTKLFEEADLAGLFLSVGWSSGKYPEKLKLAMRNSDRVVSAWDNTKLVGLMNSLSDGIMTAYFHYLLIRPEYQGKGIGKSLVSSMTSYYQDFARKVLIAYDKEIAFYEKMGFQIGTEKTPMFITYLTT